MEQIDEIKQKIDIVSLISEYVTLKKMGRNLKACCPFHSEKTPSFVVSPDRQIWHCFGCNMGGDVFEFIEKIENVEFAEAFRILAQKAGVKIENVHFDPSSAQKKERLYQANHLASEFYHYLLLNHKSGKKALEYILSRGITKKSLEIFKIGYAPNAWEGVSKFLLKKRFNTDEIEEAGLIIRDRQRNSCYDRFRGRLMFTLKDHRSNVVGFAGRILESSDEQAKYINTPETPVYIKGNILYGLEIAKESIRKQNQAIIVEGEIDAISSYQIGIANIVAIKGSALTEGQLTLLKRFTDTILLSLDADLAGDMAARRGIEQAEKMGFTIRVVQLVFGKDPNECIQKDPGLWRESIQKAVSIYDFYLDSSISKFNPQEAEGKKKISGELLPIYYKIENLVVRDYYIKLLSQKINVGVDILLSEMKRISKEEKVPTITTNSIIKAAPTTRSKVIEEYLLALVLQSVNPNVWKSELKNLSGFFQDDALFRIVKYLLESFESGHRWKLNTFITIIPKELVGIVDRLYLTEIDVDGKEDFTEEFKQTGKELELIFLKDKLIKLGEEIRDIQDEKELIRLNNLFDETALSIKKIAKVE